MHMPYLQVVSASLPSSNVTKEDLTFLTSYPIFMKIDNSNPLRPRLFSPLASLRKCTAGGWTTLSVDLMSAGHLAWLTAKGGERDDQMGRPTGQDCVVGGEAIVSE